MWRCASECAKSHAYTNTDANAFAIDIVELGRSTLQFFCSTATSIRHTNRLFKWPVRKRNNLRWLRLWKLLFRVVLLW
jgi:hypothetical protein